MKYLNFILTIISILLIIIILKMDSGSTKSKAASNIVDVNIKQIGGQSIYSKYLEFKK
jgi:uncharacterized membrane protein